MPDDDAKDLVQKLDGLPLALATAGAYLKRSPVSMRDYIRLYEQSWAKITGNLQLGSYADRTLSSTWQLSYQQVQAQNPLAAHLLRWWAYFNNEDIWFGLVSPRRQDGPVWMEQLSEELNFNDAMGVLHDYGLVEHTTTFPESPGYSIHGCLHSWTLHILNEPRDSLLNKLAVESVASQIPSDDELGCWFLQKRLIPHAVQSCSTVRDYDLPSTWAFDSLGELFLDQRELDEAEKMFLQALNGNEKAFGPDHLSTLHTVHCLGIVYWHLFKLNEAEKMYLRALSGYEEALEPDHTSTLEVVNNLGLLYSDQKKLDEAEKMFLRVVNWREKALGPDHKSTIDVVNNIAGLCWDQGKLGEAEEIFLRVLNWRKRKLGPDHIRTLMVVYKLGGLYADQGKPGKAEEMYLRVLNSREKALGPDHILTLDVVTNLGGLYWDQGKLGEAEKLYLRALNGYESAAGPNKAETRLPALRTLRMLGHLRLEQNRLGEGRLYHQRAHDGLEHLLGPSHPAVQSARQTLEIIDAVIEDATTPSADQHPLGPPRPAVQSARETLEIVDSSIEAEPSSSIDQHSTALAHPQASRTRRRDKLKRILGLPMM